ncbi:MAG: AAA family ATPase [Flavobacteriaceae bacterium]|nr:AAA family ATPase [Flavobacteriaceae bacterium]
MMPYIHALHIDLAKNAPYPFDVSAIKYAKNLQFSKGVNFIIGENGCGKSTLLETLGMYLQLPHLDGNSYHKNCFSAAQQLVPFLQLEWGIQKASGFFFRAEDFGDLVNSVQRRDIELQNQLDYLVGDVPDKVIQQMKENANEQTNWVRKNYGQELESFSHGEAYLHILHQKVNRSGIYLLDEPEASLSPARQLSFLYFIQQHMALYQSQFIIATHSPILMAYPGANLLEIGQDGIQNTSLEACEHYSLSKQFLNNPESFLRHL